MKQQEFFFALENIDTVAKSVLALFPQERIFFLKGNLGAGKTTFIKALCAQLGVEDALSSPSFSIVNEYHSSTTSQQVYHMDLYRLKSIDEAESIGLHEYLDSGNYCFIEWPELIEKWQNGTTLQFEIIDNHHRKISI